jgi:hypothetical protein
MQEHRQHAGPSLQRLRRAAADDHGRFAVNDFAKQPLLDLEQIALVHRLHRRRGEARIGSAHGERLADARPPRADRFRRRRQVVVLKIFGRNPQHLAVDEPKTETVGHLAPNEGTAAAALPRDRHCPDNSLHRSMSSRAAPW